MLLPFTIGQITCYCPRKMLLSRRQITRRKLCFYYTWKFGVISIKYVIKYLYCFYKNASIYTFDMMVGWLYRRLYEIKYINGKICQAKATNLYCMTDIIYIIT